MSRPGKRDARGGAGDQEATGASGAARPGPGEGREDELVELSDALLQVTRALIGVSAQAAIGVADVTLAQLRVLVVLATRGRHTIGDLADVLSINPSGATRLTDRLVAKGLVDKVESDQDRRVTHIDVTEKGHRLVARVTERRRAAIDALVAKIPPERRRLLIPALRDLAREAGEPEAYDLLPWPLVGLTVGAGSTGDSATGLTATTRENGESWN